MPDGTLTYSVALTDAAGNTGAYVAATATLDKTAPAGYTITADQNSINASQDTAASFTFNNAEEFTTYNYTVTSNGGSGSVTGTGTVLSATQQVTGINVSSLPDGTLTYSVALTDAAGNVGGTVTATATLDKTAPTGYAVSVDQSQIGSGDERGDQLHAGGGGTRRDVQLHRDQRRQRRRHLGRSAAEQLPRPPSRSPASTFRRCPMATSPTA